MTQPINEQDLIQKAINLPLTAKPVQPTQQSKPVTNEQDLVQKAINLPNEDVSIKQRALLGLIKEDPDLQLEFLKRQGFDAQLDQGIVKIRDRAGNLNNYNPEGLDFGDIIEYLPEFVEGVVGAIATGTKAMGALGAPATGGASIAAGAAAGGAVTGAAELGKQTLAKGFGLREDINVGRVARQAGIGAAVPTVFPGIAAAAKKTGRGISQAIFGGAGPKPVDVRGIQEAGKLIGAKPTPGMLTTDPVIKATEAVLSKQHFGIGGMVLRKQQRVNQAATIEAAESLLKNKTERSAFEVGEAFQEKILKDVSKKLQPAEKLYGEVAKTIGDVRADTSLLSSKIEQLRGRMKFSTEGNVLLSKIEAKLGDIKSVEDLKLFRTAIRDEIPPTASKNMKIVADEIYQAATKARSDSFVNQVRNLKGEFAPEAHKKLLDKIKDADKIYADTANLVQKSLLSQGKSVTKGVKRTAAEAIEGVIPEQRVAKFFPGVDAAKVEALKKLSPAGFDQLAGAKMAQIAEKATSQAMGSFGALRPNVVAQEIEKLSPEVATSIFGKEGVKKAKAIAKFYKAIPADLNPSGTATTIGLMATTFRQVSSAMLSAINTFLRTKGDVSKTALFTTLSAAMDRQTQPSGQFDRPVQDPFRQQKQ
jgi:hypothetical protein